MRTISAAQQAILDAPGGRTVRLRVWVRDGGGTDRDLSTYAGTLVPGLNLVTSGQVRDDVDANGQTATFTFKRNVDGINLSPLMEASPLRSLHSMVIEPSPSAIFTVSIVPSKRFIQSPDCGSTSIGTSATSAFTWRCRSINGA